MTEVNENNSQDETAETEAPAIPKPVLDPMSANLVAMIEAANAEVREYEAAKAAAESAAKGTPVNTIKAALKKPEEITNDEVRKQAEAANKALETAKAKLQAAINAYRVHVLNEEEQEEIDLPDIEVARQRSNSAKTAVGLLKQFNAGNPEVLAWADTITILVPGRKAVSGGAEKNSAPRAYVKDLGTETIYNSFGEAAKELKLDRSALVQAWKDAGGTNENVAQTFALGDSKFSSVPKK